MIALVGGVGVLLFGGLVLLQRVQTGPDPARRYAATTTDVPYALVPLVPEGRFDRPVGITLLPDSADVAVVPTQGGRIWRVPLSGEARPTLLGDIGDRLIAEPDFEEGLVGLAFSPDYRDDGRLYLAYAAGAPRRSVLARFQVHDGQLNPQSEVVLLELPQPTSTHNIGQLAFGPDRYLYAGFGDGGSEGDALGLAQELGTLYGAILRLDVTDDAYRIPADNPFVDVPAARSEIYAYGLRNPWRFSFDALTGDLWAGDVGEVGWEEVNRILPGANYGWNLMEGFGL
ncbi:MAG: sorbosone dehydrogenase family protein [Dehalococcoidia bacterium]